MFKNVALWIIIAIAMVMLFQLLNNKQPIRTEISYSEFIAQVTSDNVAAVTIKEKKINGETSDGTQFDTYAPDDAKMVDLLREHNVKINAQPADSTPWYMQLLISWLPIIILIGLWIFFMRNMQGGAGNKAFSFGKSRARMMVQDQRKITFKDVAGVDEAKEELEEIVEFLKEPSKFQRLGGKIPKGVLLVGPPGTGKTLLARAVAGEAGVAFFSISGSDFVEMFVGVGAARIRDLFEQGKKNAPCIIFMDEIDAVGRHRGAGLGGGHDEREQTLNALLVEMDGFESTEGVILIAATNRPDVLDPALLRPGRFDRQVIVPLPDYKGRMEILKVHIEKVPLADEVNLEVVARGTPGFSGADMANLVNEAALMAARAGKDKVESADFDEARDKITMGKARKNNAITEKEKNMTAYHEAGHAIVASMTPFATPVHKVTIIPRGMAGGYTSLLPEERSYESKDHLTAMITLSMGGRAAESLVFGHFTTGARTDIQHSTDIAQRMVTVYGMSEQIGPISYGKKEEAIFLGKDIATHKNYSEQTAVIIDGEVRKIVESCYKKAYEILNYNKLLLDKMAEMLLEKETILAVDVDNLVKEYADEKWREMATVNAVTKKGEAGLTD
ncbi:MAG: ATP-dependent zinc metalloprotease FtsH [Deferribacteraceae bacterium]|jgi:cell division protease FtsH|nr:ATP-dependent zinc metalloprotease FtsH [Deferribacteraceae bacterium]